MSLKLNTDRYTIEDIIKALKQPNRDFRDDFELEKDPTLLEVIVFIETFPIPLLTKVSANFFGFVYFNS